jgi:hypothetical protein
MNEYVIKPILIAAVTIAVYLGVVFLSDAVTTPALPFETEKGDVYLKSSRRRRLFPTVRIGTKSKPGRTGRQKFGRRSQYER